MKKNHRSKLLAIATVTVLLSGCAALTTRSLPKHILLRYKLVPNESLKYKAVLNGSGRIEIRREQEATLKRKVGFTQTLFYNQTTAKRASDFSQIKLTYDDINIQVSIDDKEQPNVSANLEASKQLLLNQNITFLRSDRGEIKDIAGFDNIAQEFLRNKPLGEDKDVVISTGVFRSMNQFIQRSVSQNVRSFPEETVQKGHSWEEEIEQDIPMLGKVMSKYSGKLVGFEKVNNTLCAKIRYNHEMVTPLAAQEFKGMQFKQKITGQGYHYFSIEGSKTAYLIKTTSRVSSDLEIQREMLKADGTSETVKNIVSMKLDSIVELIAP